MQLAGVMQSLLDDSCQSLYRLRIPMHVSLNCQVFRSTCDAALLNERLCFPVSPNTLFRVSGLQVLEPAENYAVKADPAKFGAKPSTLTLKP